MRIVVANIAEGLTRLNVSKTSYYRWRRQGKASDEIVIVDGQPMLAITLFDEVDKPEMLKDEQVSSIFSHRRYMREWIQYNEDGLKVRRWSQRHRRDQVEYLEKFFVKFDEVSADNLEKWLKTVKPDRQSLRRHMHSAVSSMAKFLCNEKKILSKDECFYIQKLYPKKDPGYETQQNIIYDEDIDHILKGIPSYCGVDTYKRVLLESLVIVLSETALRVSEMASLTLSSYKFSSRPEEAFIRVRGKGNKVRQIPFSLKAQDAIRKYLEYRPNTKAENLFWVQHDYTKKWTHLRAGRLTREIQLLFEGIGGTKFTPHSFRHYRITKWANNPRIPITSTQLWAGHSSLVVTQRYIHIRDVDALRAAFA